MIILLGELPYMHAKSVNAIKRGNTTYARSGNLEKQRGCCVEVLFECIGFVSVETGLERSW